MPECCWTERRRVEGNLFTRTPSIYGSMAVEGISRVRNQQTEFEVEGSVICEAAFKFSERLRYLQQHQLIVQEFCKAATSLYAHVILVSIVEIRPTTVGIVCRLYNLVLTPVTSILGLEKCCV